jgi:hypothetical protein
MAPPPPQQHATWQLEVPEEEEYVPDGLEHA